MKTAEFYKPEAIFPKPLPWLCADDLKGYKARVQIADATIETIAQEDGRFVRRAALSFVDKQRRLLLGETQHSALCAIVGSDDTDHWRGVEVILCPEITEQGESIIKLAALKK